jgi:cob(I)alamin adenosyltransferase
VARRAERSVVKLVEIGEIGNPLLQVFLNRVSDFLWLLARASENLS